MGFWFSQIPDLKEHFQLILFDPRGVGRSDKPLTPYSIADEAGDLVELQKELGLDRAHVLGVSRGGTIAQELAIRHPDRVNRLVLAVTHLGGPAYLQATADVWAEMFNFVGLTPEQIFRRGVELVTTPEFFRSNGPIVDRIVQMRLSDPQPLHSFHLQFDSARRFDSRDRIGQIAAPTLAIAGEHDRFVPREMVVRLAGAIPGSRYLEIPGASHYVFIERPDVFNREVIRFLLD